MGRVEREGEKEGKEGKGERKKDFIAIFPPMNFNAQHWSPSRILGSHLLEKKKVMRNAVLCSLLLHGEMFHVVVCICVCAWGKGGAQDV